MALIHQKKKKYMPLILGVVIGVIAVMVLILFLIKGRENKALEVVATDLSTEETEPSTKIEEMTTEYEIKSKEYYIDYVVLGDEQETGEFLDIRIRFPNGEDYIVVSGKTITYLTDKGFYMYLDERELHMLSSARTDVDVYEGALLYLSSYGKKQEDTSTDYPINLFVLSSYPDYFTDIEQIYNRRIQLEENLLTFMNQTLQK